MERIPIYIDVPGGQRLPDKLRKKLNIVAGGVIPPEGNSKNVDQDSGCPPNRIRLYGARNETETIETIRGSIEEAMPGIKVNISDLNDVVTY